MVQVHCQLHIGVQGLMVHSHWAAGAHVRQQAVGVQVILPCTSSCATHKWLRWPGLYG